MDSDNEELSDDENSVQEDTETHEDDNNDDNKDDDNCTWQESARQFVEDNVDTSIFDHQESNIGGDWNNPQNGEHYGD